MPDFVHLHVHSEYSLLDGACRIEGLVARAKELGQKAVAVTDHGVMYAAVDFYKEAKKQGIKPIIGCEVYVAPRTRFDKVHRVDSSPFHLLLLCENETGYRNLIKLVSQSFIEGFYTKPRVDTKLLRAHHEGLIALSACLAGRIPQLLLAGDFEGAKAAALEYRDIFGAENFFIEIQDHGLEEQKRVLPLLLRLSKELNIPLAATNDAHYLARGDAAMQNVLVCIQINQTVNDKHNLEFGTEEFYIKSGEEMAALFPTLPEALENTVKIAERCTLDFTFGVVKLPRFTAPNGRNNREYLRSLCEEGLRRHFGANPAPAVRERLESELSVIESMGYVDYYLIVADFIRYARSKDIPVGPGRGSGAGSLAAYCVGITNIDPLRYHLIFERFLNPERVSMPDFDVDFCYVRRQEVIDYVVSHYGADHVAQIITFGTLAARAAIRDVGRALGVSLRTVDAVAKLVPNELGITLEKALVRSPELKTAYDTTPEVQTLLDMAKRVEGMPRHASVHAAGVVITDGPVDEYVPLQRSDEAVVTQYPMGTLEELGLLKVDFLGLRNLTVIHDVERMLAARGVAFHIADIPLDDPAVYAMLAAAQTQGVFQFESSGMRQVLQKLGPEHMEDLIAVISLYRPGPMESIPTYIRNRHDPAQIRYKHPLLEPILKVTYGCIVYQEQVMQICRELAGFSYGRADLVRRAMAKKKAEAMRQERKNFLYGMRRADGSLECEGAIARGVDEATANDIFDEMDAFASYAFNKSHAAAYALVAYQTAYLKCHYPREYMAALLTSILDNTSKVTEYIGECERLGIKILPPDVSQSEEGFAVAPEGIRFGLLAIKNIGRGFIRELLTERRAAPFRDIFDFFMRLCGRELNKRTLEGLIRSGALDSFGYNRRQLAENYDGLLAAVENIHKDKLSGQLGFFDQSDEDFRYRIDPRPEFPMQELLRMEKETLGFYISGHPIADYRAQIEAAGFDQIGALLDTDSPRADGTSVSLLAVVAGVRLRPNKNNETTAYLTIEDATGQIELRVYANVYKKVSVLIKPDAVLYIRARVELRDDVEPKLICDLLAPPSEAPAKAPKGSYRASYERSAPYYTPPRAALSPPAPAAPPAAARSNQRPGLYLKVPDKGCPEAKRALAYLRIFEGATPVYLYSISEKQLFAAPRQYLCAPNPTLMSALAELLGEKNVALIANP